MPRELRIHYEDAFYHVMLRGNCRERIFFCDEDRVYFLKLLYEGASKYKSLIHSFCLMDNHVHLLMQVTSIPLAKTMHNLSFRFASYINTKKDRVGHLFQGRYKSILVENEEYLLELIRYIHLNPIKARVVNRLNEYKWSSHNAYINQASYSWLTKSYILDLFNKDRKSAVADYDEFMKDKILDLDLGCGADQIKCKNIKIWYVIQIYPFCKSVASIMVQLYCH